MKTPALFRSFPSALLLMGNLATPALGFSVCFYIWLHLSRFALALGGLWLALGFFYLLFLTRGFKQTIADLKLSRSELRQ